MLDFDAEDDLTPMTPEEIAKKDAEVLAGIIHRGEQKRNKVHRFISANPNWGLRKIVEKFDLYWTIDHQFDNGLIRVGFYTGEDCRTRVTETVCSATNNGWFRD